MLLIRLRPAVVSILNNTTLITVATTGRWVLLTVIFEHRVVVISPLLLLCGWCQQCIRDLHAWVLSAMCEPITRAHVVHHALSFVSLEHFYHLSDQEELVDLRSLTDTHCLSPVLLPAPWHSRDVAAGDYPFSGLVSSHLCLLLFASAREPCS